MRQPEDDQSFFVSRRGKQVGVHQVDMSGIDIESNDVQTTTASKKSSKTKKTSTSPHQPTATRSFMWSKKKIVLLCVILILLSLPLLIAESIAAQFRNGPVDANRELKSIIETTVLPAQSKATISSKQLREISGSVNSIVGNMCRGGLLDNAAKIYPRANAALTDCKASQQNFSTLVSSVTTVELQARYLERVDSIMKPISTPITEEYAVIGSQQSAWKLAADELAKLSPPSTMAAAHSTLINHTKAAAEAWTKLNIANNSQDAVGFEEAEQALNAEYEAVRNASSGFNEAIINSQAKLSETVKRIEL